MARNASANSPVARSGFAFLDARIGMHHGGGRLGVDLVTHVVEHLRKRNDFDRRGCLFAGQQLAQRGDAIGTRGDNALDVRSGDMVAELLLEIGARGTAVGLVFQDLAAAQDGNAVDLARIAQQVVGRLHERHGVVQKRASREEQRFARRYALACSRRYGLEPRIRARHLGTCHNVFEYVFVHYGPSLHR